MKKNLLTLCACLLFAGTARGITIEVGHHELRPNMAQQRVPITVISEEADPAVVGFNLVGQLGDGLGSNPEPIFHGAPDSLDGIDFSGGIWDIYSASTSGMAPVRDNLQFATASVTFNNSGDAIAPNGLIATLLVDTTGFGEGEYALKLQGTQANDSQLILAGGEEMSPTIVNGMISIVPEPSSLVLTMAAFGILCLGVRRRPAH